MGYEDLRVAIKNNENDIKYKITLDNINWELFNYYLFIKYISYFIIYNKDSYL
jgi:hypothetical protein